jgi:hypothetical protein
VRIRNLLDRPQHHMLPPPYLSHCRDVGNVCGPFLQPPATLSFFFSSFPSASSSLLICDGSPLTHPFPYPDSHFTWFLRSPSAPQKQPPTCSSPSLIVLVEGHVIAERHLSAQESLSWPNTGVGPMVVYPCDRWKALESAAASPGDDPTIVCLAGCFSDRLARFRRRTHNRGLMWKAWCRKSPIWH